MQGIIQNCLEQNKVEWFKTIFFFQATRLKRLMKPGKSLMCENEGCRAKFSTAAGYLAHQKICGVKEEDREKFTCEICEKVYMSSMGLKYHMQAKHTEVSIIIL